MCVQNNLFRSEKSGSIYVWMLRMHERLHSWSWSTKLEVSWLLSTPFWLYDKGSECFLQPQAKQECNMETGIFNKKQYLRLIKSWKAIFKNCQFYSCLVSYFWMKWLQPHMLQNIVASNIFEQQSHASVWDDVSALISFGMFSLRRSVHKRL